MASRTACDPRKWKTFWGHIDKNGNRFRHQVRHAKHDPNHWEIRTEVWMDGDPMPYHTATIHVLTEVGKDCFQLEKVYSNVDEHLNPMYPPQYAGGFPLAETMNAE